MWYSSFDDTTWVSQQPIPDPIASSASPSSTTFQGSLYAVWKGSYNYRALWLTRFNGGAWEPQLRLRHFCTKRGPISAVFRDGLCIAYREALGNADATWCTFLDGAIWRDKIRAGFDTGERSALATWGDEAEKKLVWNGNGVDKCIYSSTYDGSTWSRKESVHAATTSSRPSLVNFDDVFYVIWRADGDDNGI